MSLTLQNLRAVGTGVQPSSLLPGQIAFNVTDKVLFVGDGSSFNTQFDGSQVVGVPGEGWFTIPLSYNDLGEYYLFNPEQYGPPATEGQLLAYSTALDAPVWLDGVVPPPASSVYTTTNADVTAAPGATTSDKISSAIGDTPVEADAAIVSGVPGDIYQGLYLFVSGNWVFAAGYADPTAIQVPYDGTISGLLAATVQAAIDELVVNTDLAQTTADVALTNSNNAINTANAALPKSGGTMTGDINFNNNQPVDAGLF